MAPLTTKRIGVLMGGRSAERDISLKSGEAVLAALKRQGYEAVAVDVDDRVAETVRSERVDIAFIALHGRGGEDGAIQGLLEVMRIPYTGSGIMASAIGMHKIMTKRLLLHHGVPTPRFSVVTRAEGNAKQLPFGFSYPIVVKPATQGSTIGISVARDDQGLAEGLALAFSYDRDVLLEEYIDGKEVTAGVLNHRPLPLIEIAPKDKFYDFKAKYTAGMTDYILPARVEPALYEEIQQFALKAHRFLGCAGASRVDFRIDSSGTPLALEINTCPGMLETSLLPRAAQAAGLSYDQLVEKILADVLERNDAN